MAKKPRAKRPEREQVPAATIEPITPWVQFPDLRETLKPFGSGPFFALHPELLENIVRYVGEDAFDPKVLDVERQVGAALGDQTWNVGVWHGRPIQYDLLRPPQARPLVLEPEQVDGLGWGKNAVQLKRLAGGFGEKIKWVQTIARGYAGWLMMNTEFLAEHDALIAAWAPQTQQHGFPNAGFAAVPPFQVPPGWEEADDESKAFADAVETFLVRWRLESLAAPGLPRPLGPQLPVATTFGVLRCMHKAGVLWYLPETYPIPSRDDLRDALEGIRDQQTPTHLEAWSRIVRAGNQAKQQIGRFARLFELRHYWSALHGHHPSVFCRRGNMKAIRASFAVFLKTKPETTRKDLVFIRKQLGKTWCRLG